MHTLFFRSWNIPAHATYPNRSGAIFFPPRCYSSAYLSWLKIKCLFCLSKSWHLWSALSLHSGKIPPPVQTLNCMCYGRTICQQLKVPINCISQMTYKAVKGTTNCLILNFIRVSFLYLLSCLLSCTNKQNNWQTKRQTKTFFVYKIYM